MDKDLEKEIDELFKKAEKEQYVHSRSSEVFDDIAGLWFADQRITDALIEISRQYIISSCLLRLLGMMYKQDFNGVSPIESVDLTDIDKRTKLLVETAAVNPKLVKWYAETALPAAIKALQKATATDLESIARLGNCADSTTRFAQHMLDAGEDMWLNDSLFQFVEMVLEQEATNEQYDKISWEKTR